MLLQGLLLQPPNYWPGHLSFALREHHSRWLETLRNDGVSPLTGAFGFIRSCSGVEAVLCGVASRQELCEVLQAWGQSNTHILVPSDTWAWHNKLDLDPRGWPT